MIYKNKYRIIIFIATVFICFIVIYLNLLSHQKTQEIYMTHTKKNILNLKKDFLKDTIENMFIEMDEIRETKHRNYKKNTEARLRWMNNELDLNENEFNDFFVNTFKEDEMEGMWTALLWNDATGEILYDSSDLDSDNLNYTIDELKDTILSSYAQIENGSIKGIFGVSNAYIEQSAKNEIGNIIRNRKFSNDSYIWVNEIINYEGGDAYAIRRVHPNLKETEGMTLSTGMQDIAGNLPYLEELEGIREHEEIFYTYFFKKFNSDEISEKMTYAKLYKEYDWIVAMGVHFDDIDPVVQNINNEISELSKDTIIQTLKYIFSVLILGFLVLYLLEKRNLLNSTHNLEKQVNIDLVTKAFSRRFGEKNIQEYFKQYILNKKTTAIMMFDLDDFKSINDKYGHNMGDVVLYEVCQTINQMNRSSDFLVRWGGDEFIGVFPGLKEEIIPEFGQKIMDAISSLEIKTGEGNIKVSISVGFAVFDETDTDYNDAIKRADDALYKSKREGKNKVTINTQ